MSPSRPERPATAPNPGLLVGAAFGLVFLLANSGAPLPAAAGGAIKACGAAAVTAVFWAQLRTRRRAATDADRDPINLGGRAFRLVVAGEVAAGCAGLLGLRIGGAPWQANVAWIATVVGAHFLVLARLWADTGIRVVGAALTLVGVAGLAMAAAGTGVAWIPAVSGVASGVTLVAGSLAASLGTRGAAR